MTNQQENIAELKAKFLEYFAKTPIQKFAGGYIGKCEDTITDWKKADSDFSDSIEKLKAEYVQAKLNQVQSREWILERLFKGDFSQRNEVTGANGEALIPKPILGNSTVQDDLPSNNGNEEVASTQE